MAQKKLPAALKAHQFKKGGKVKPAGKMGAKGGRKSGASKKR